jgi:hypothetical protein
MKVEYVPPKELGTAYTVGLLLILAGLIVLVSALGQKVGINLANF